MKQSNHFFGMARVAAIIVALLVSMVANAAPQNFSIPAGELKAAVEAYVAATGKQIVYKASDLTGRTCKGVQGAMTADQALDHLLAGTNLKLRRDESGAVVIFQGGDGSNDTSASQSRRY